MYNIVDVLATELLKEAFTSNEYHPDIEVSEPIRHPEFNTDKEEQSRTNKILSSYFPNEDPATLFLHGTNNMFLPHRLRRTTPELARAGDPQSFLAPAFTHLLPVARNYASDEDKGRILVAKIHQGPGVPLHFGDIDADPVGSYTHLGNTIKGIEAPVWPEARGGVALSREFKPNPQNSEEFERHFNSLSKMQRHLHLLNKARTFAKSMSDRGFDIAVHGYPKGGAGSVIQPLLLKRVHIIGEIPSSEIARPY
jgi:hypothetical protein